MKKILLVCSVLYGFIVMSSCSTDDSNDIEIIKPGDTVITGNGMAHQVKFQ